MKHTQRIKNLPPLGGGSSQKNLVMEIDEGEAEAIVLALEDLILLDDYEAREIARTYELNITGVICVLIRAKKEGRIDNLKEELDKLKETGFWISNDIYTKILKE